MLIKLDPFFTGGVYDTIVSNHHLAEMTSLQRFPESGNFTKNGSVLPRNAARSSLSIEAKGATGPEVILLRWD